MKKEIIVKGYIKVYLPSHPNAKKGYIFQHRIIVELYIGRFLTNKEIVHHIDFDKKNNRIENLMLFPNQKAHSSFHRKIKQFGITEPIKRQIKNRWNSLIVK